jgi:spore germination cell wall hydrolase CwlJ-like protein
MTPVLTLQPLRPWRTHPRETIAVAMLGGALLALATVSGASPLLPQFAQQAGTAAIPAPPKPLPSEVRDLAPEAALAVNAQIPIAVGPNPAATPFAFKGSKQDRSRALECMTSAIYYEAGQESENGQRAVAQVVLNRVRHPAFPNSVCGVVYEGSTRPTGCQFTFTCDGSMSRAPVPALWNRARKIADKLLAGGVFPDVGYATHYHAKSVVPYWASSLTTTKDEGAHLFYRWPGGWGQPTAFTDRWSAHEGDPSALRLAALSAPHFTAPVQSATAAVSKLEAAGAKVTTGTGGRVRVLFTPQAREVVEKIKLVPYVDRSAASDNLRFALEGSSKEAEQPAFGPSSKDAAPETEAR